jgi:D-lactate dehydrogenase (cytochrome)
VTEATLKLARIPEETGVAVTSFPTMRDAANAAIQVVRQGIPVGAVELLDDVQMDVINRMGDTGREWKAEPTLFFKFSGTKVGVQDNIDGVSHIVHANHGSDLEVEKDTSKQEALWFARKQALWSMLCLRESGHEVWSTDVAVPLSKVSDLVGNLEFAYSIRDQLWAASNTVIRDFKERPRPTRPFRQYAWTYRGWQLP